MLVRDLIKAILMIILMLTSTLFVYDYLPDELKWQPALYISWLFLISGMIIALQAKHIKLSRYSGMAIAALLISIKLIVAKNQFLHISIGTYTILYWIVAVFAGWICGRLLPIRLTDQKMLRS